MNHYELLGVPPTSDVAAIKRAYLAAARRVHPDFHADADEAVRTRNAQHMQQLNDAWAVLSDATARRAYDQVLATATDPGVVRRVAREPNLPEGKGWTPRAGDDGWMTDYQGWVDEADELPPDQPRSTGRRLVTVLPVGLFFAAVISIFVGMAMGSDGLVALGAICFIFSAGLFILLPMFEMARGRRR